MATYVLVHGAWHGGWCWRRVAERLRAAGHTVFTPTLTGLGERAHLRTSEVGLSTHVADVCGVLRYEDLHEVRLAGHSYAGLVVREAADRMPGRVGEVIMLDAWAGRTGESFDDRSPDWFRAWIDSLTEGDTVRAPAPRAVGVTDPDTAARLESLLTPQPRRSFTEPTTLTGAVDAIPCRALVCAPSRMPFHAMAEEFGWPTTDLRAGHDAMVTHPEELTRLLLVGAPRPDGDATD